MKFEKNYVLDTNIILDNPDNLIRISQEGKNQLIIPEIVIDELDAKKSGFEDINYNARQFARLLEESEILENYANGDLRIIVTEIKSLGIKLKIVSKSEYKCEQSNVAINILNDRKILEVADYVNQIITKDGDRECVFLSLDIMARTRALSLGIKTETLNIGLKDDLNYDLDFHMKFELDNYTGNLKDFDISKIEPNISSFEILDLHTGNPYYYIRNNEIFELLDDKNTNKICMPPKNLMQRVMSQIIMNKNDITIVSGQAGTGKNIVATSSAMRLIDLNKDVYHKIYYIRRTVISGDKQDELGFLPGSLEEKTSYYNYPMKDTLKKIVKTNFKKINLNDIDEINAKIVELEKKYQIEYLYAGHLRGSTLDDGSILICDEIQNWDIKSIRTIFSRLGQNSIIIGIGSNNQIDSPYLNKYNNALTFLTKKCGIKNEADVSITGVKLHNVVRSKIAKFSDDELN